MLITPYSFTMLKELLTRYESGIAALWEGEREKHKSLISPSL